MENKEIRNIITIGASAGGLSAVSKLLSVLPKDIDAAIFIVIHLSKDAILETVLNLLGRKSAIEIQIPKDGTPIKKGIAYLAPIDDHMMLSQGKIVISRGAKENHWRPAIDVLFRTAAAAYGSCVTGIILSGLLDDGTSGMIAIKGAGGICIVQEPEEAEYPDMPTSVIKNIEVDYRVPIDDIGYILNDLFSRKECLPHSIPEHIIREAKITIRMGSDYEETAKLGSPTAITCPDCGGMLTKIEEHGEYRYRCFTGHVFSESFLDKQYIEKIEETLWVAIRMMEERRNFILGQPHVHQSLVTEQNKRGVELKAHIDRLKNVLDDMGEVKE